MKSAKAHGSKNFNYLKYGVAIGLGFTGLSAALGSLANTEVSAFNHEHATVRDALGSLANTEVSAPARVPQIDMYSAAKIKFPIEKAKDLMFTSDAWRSNSIGETHAPIPN